jgi:tripartite ATP-independent transporter DctM subunit
VTGLEIGIAAVVILIVLIFLGMPIGIGMLTVSLVGVAMIRNEGVAIRMAGSVANDALRSYLFAVVPLFVLMGLLVTVSGVGKDTFDVFQRLLRRLAAGLGVATVFANAVFAAITGISIASATVFARVAVPEMTRHGYSRRFSTGVVAGSSVLGMLIPPSLLMIVYAVLAEQSVGRMFLAGVGPGLLLALLFSGTILLLARFRPGFVFDRPDDAAPAEDITTWEILRKGAPILSLIFLVLGGLYLGFLNPTEAGAVGALGALILALMRRSLDRRSFWGIMVESGQITVSVLFLIMAATFFSRMLTLFRPACGACRRVPNRAHRAVGASFSSTSCWLQRARPGNAISSATSISEQAMKGIAAPGRSGAWSCPVATPFITNSSSPKGGVVKLISSASSMIRPNQIGSKPRLVASGKKIGTVRSIMEICSMNMPSISSTPNITRSMAIGFEIEPGGPADQAARGAGEGQKLAERRRAEDDQIGHQRDPQRARRTRADRLPSGSGKTAARISTPSAPKAAASDGVTIPPIIMTTITTIRPTIGTTSRNQAASLRANRDRLDVVGGRRLGIEAGLQDRCRCRKGEDQAGDDAGDQQRADVDLRQRCQQHGERRGRDDDGETAGAEDRADRHVLLVAALVISGTISEPSSAVEPIEEPDRVENPVPPSTVT